MTLRSQQTVALIVLLAVLGVVFVLVGDSGVSTAVFRPEHTATLTPTLAPSPTATLVPSAGNWVEQQPGTLTYMGQPDIEAQVTYLSGPLAEMITQWGLQMPPDDSEYPLYDVLTQYRTELETQIADPAVGLTVGEFVGPALEVVNNTLVNHLYLRIPAQARGDGQQFPGLELSLDMIDQGEGNMTMVQYSVRGEPDPTVYNDYRAWLADYIEKLAAPEAAATEEAAPDATEEIAPEATQAATEEAAPAAEEATEEIAPAATEEIVPDVTPAATEEPAS